MRQTFLKTPPLHLGDADEWMILTACFTLSVSFAIILEFNSNVQTVKATYWHSLKNTEHPELSLLVVDYEDRIESNLVRCHVVVLQQGVVILPCWPSSLSISGSISLQPEGFYCTELSLAAPPSLSRCHCPLYLVEALVRSASLALCYRLSAQLSFAVSHARLIVCRLLPYSDLL